MGLSRLSNGERIMAVSAILLFVFMFFDWFGLKAWEALDYIPIILGITIFAALGIVALRVTAIRKPSVPANMLVAILGTLSTMLIVYRIADPPNFGSFQEAWGTITIEGTVQFPIFLALVAATGIAFGGFLALREELRIGGSG